MLSGGWHGITVFKECHCLPGSLKEWGGVHASALQKLFWSGRRGFLRHSREARSRFGRKWGGPPYHWSFWEDQDGKRGGETELEDAGYLTLSRGKIRARRMTR